MASTPGVLRISSMFWTASFVSIMGITTSVSFAAVA